MRLEALIDNIEKNHRIVSIVGAGGKSTLMETLARKLTGYGHRVLNTTTTHIWQPADGTYAASLEEAEQLWNRGYYAVAGVPDQKCRLTALREEDMRCYMKAADIIFIEADGARRMPCKLPAAHEPVILEESSLVIGVMGMDCLGQRIKDCCFRWQEGAAWLDAEGGERMTPELAARILSSEQGTRKNCGGRAYAVVLNKCDTAELLMQAEDIKNKLEKYGIKEVVKTSLKRGTDT